MPTPSEDIAQKADPENVLPLPGSGSVGISPSVSVAPTETTEEAFGAATPCGMPGGEELLRLEPDRVLEDVEVELDPDALSPARSGCPLSPRERQILELVSTGMRNPEIACSLGVAPSTIATHMKSVARKLGARSRPHAVRIALLSGEIGPRVAQGGSATSV